MPCTSDYPEPTAQNRRFQETARLALYVDKRLNKSAVPSKASASAKKLPPVFKDKNEKDLAVLTAQDEFAHVDFVPRLCLTLRNVKAFDEALFDRIVYNAKDPDSRALADWWEEHERADKEREIREKASQKMDKDVRDLLSAMTPKRKSVLKAILQDRDRIDEVLAMLCSDEDLMSGE